MKKHALGTAIHALLDGHDVSGHDRAALRMVADDIESSGIGGPLETELHHASIHESDPARKEFARRLLGNVRKWCNWYG